MAFLVKGPAGDQYSTQTHCKPQRVDQWRRTRLERALPHQMHPIERSWAVFRRYRRLR